MTFYHLYMPEYASENEYELVNCCFEDPLRTLAMPGVTCSVCGKTWARSGECLITDQNLSVHLRQRLAEVQNVSLEVYEELEQAVCQDLGLPPSSKLLPGTRIGRLMLKCECTDTVPDFLWDLGAQLVVRNSVLEAVMGAGLTGCEAQPVHITNATQTRIDLPPLHEFVVVGRGGPMSPEARTRLVSECAKCGYRQYEPVYYGRSGAYSFQGLYVNPESWDGSDFFIFDDWPTIIMMTERAHIALTSAGLTNWQAYPAPQGAFKW